MYNKVDEPRTKNNLIVSSGLLGCNVHEWIVPYHKKSLFSRFRISLLTTVANRNLVTGTTHFRWSGSPGSWMIAAITCAAWGYNFCLILYKKKSDNGGCCFIDGQNPSRTGQTLFAKCRLAGSLPTLFREQNRFSWILYPLRPPQS